MAILIGRTLLVTPAPIFGSLRRVVPRVATAVGEADAAQRGEEHVGHRGAPEAALVRPHGLRTRPVGEEVEPARLDPVVHLSSRTVEPLVERLGRVFRR